MNTTIFNSWSHKVGLILWTLLVITLHNLNAQINEITSVDISQSLISARAFEGVETLKKQIVELDLQNTNKGVNLYTTTIGKNPIPAIRVATLPEHDPWFGSSSKRRSDIATFISKAKRDYEYLSGKECNEKQTNFYRTLVYSLGKVDLSYPTTYIAFSDAIEVSSVMSMLDYNPSELISSAYNEVVAKLEADAKLPDLSKVQIIIVTPGNSELVLYSSRFWKKYLSSKNAQVIIQSSF